MPRFVAASTPEFALASTCLGPQQLWRTKQNYKGGVERGVLSRARLTTGRPGPAFRGER